ncbi:putative leucine--tRNA ligase, mitochondrial [Babylonia areolata]|uniref:putative leucine--tRNA ligase, mitochondrial n=1 Tax=Babylonia areolata TaxID=304850 RepID=UPI003FD50486
MGLGAGRGLSWCAWLHRRQRHVAFTLRPLARTLFSQTGVWEKDLTPKEREQIEEHWMPIIKEDDKLRSQRTNSCDDKYYVLSMFPYPSGNLHMGHVRVYTLSDTMARFHRLAGRSVVHPMGWDAFGLPAENAAIERGEKPDQWTYENIANMRQQLEQLGCSFDWHREYATCDPAYYRWTQHLFLKLMEAGLVYQKEGEVNWDPVDMTVLADEQIDEAGRSWRSGVKAEKRFLKQWYIRTTALAQSLYEGLSEVDQALWGDIVQLQRHWIGECDGTRLQFPLVSGEGQTQYDPLHIYTATPEAVYGVAFVAVSPQHRLNQPSLYQENACPDTENIPLSLKARHPLTGECLPVIVSSSLEFDDFNDVQLGIPGVDEAARMVAEQLGIPFLTVLQDVDGEQRLVNSHDMDGLTRSEAFQAIQKKAKELGVGGDLVSRRLRDWLISRQRYWGTPIPVVHCDRCQVVPVPYEDLPVVLPAIDTFTGRGPSPLAQQHDWINTTCPRCGGEAKRETDTMDTFVDSSWYFLRYLDPHNTELPFSKEVAQRFMPVDLYIGGKEHAVMHLYYARFFCHFLYEAGWLRQREPFMNLLTQGMVMGQSYRVKGTGRYLTPDQVDLTEPKPKEKATGAPVVTEWEKMSKSKHNGVDPKLCQFCLLSYTGILRWQGRVWKLVGDFIKAATPAGGNHGDRNHGDSKLLADWEARLFEARNFTVKEVTHHCSKTFLLNTAVSRLQKFSSTLGKVPEAVRQESGEYGRCLADLCIMVAPMAPCFASEMWAGLASVCRTSTLHDSSYLWDRTVLDQAWPVIDASYKLPLIFKINHQDNGCVTLTPDVLDGLTQEQAHDLVRSQPKYQQYCQGHEFEAVHFSLHPGYQAVINIIPRKQAAAAAV